MTTILILQLLPEGYSVIGSVSIGLGRDSAAKTGLRIEQAQGPHQRNQAEHLYPSNNLGSLLPPQSRLQGLQVLQDRKRLLNLIVTNGRAHLRLTGLKIRLVYLVGNAICPT